MEQNHLPYYQFLHRNTPSFLVVEKSRNQQNWYPCSTNLSAIGNLQLEDEEVTRKWINKILEYNKDYEGITEDSTAIESCQIRTYDIFSNDWFEELKIKIRRHQYLDEKIFNKDKREKIKHRIETRFNIIQDMQSSWLNSTLERPRTNIKIGRLIEIRMKKR